MPTESNTNIIPGMPLAGKNLTELPNEEDLLYQNPESAITFIESLQRIYVVEYRADGANHTRHFLYEHADGLSGAIGRAKIFCTRMRYRFLYCSAFLTSLEKLEERMKDAM